MAKTEASIVIDAPLEAVMAEISDYESYPEWAEEVRSASITSRDEQGRGARVRFEVASGPMKADYTLEYTYRPDGTGMSWTLVEGHNVKAMNGEYVLEPQPGGATMVIYRLSVETPIPMLGFMKRQVEKRIVDVVLKGLAARLRAKA
jgi:uncharacterized membrane protein